MSKVKIKLQDNIARVVMVETDATIGATIGTDLRLPDGSVPSLTQLKALFASSSSGSGGVTHHHLLQGLSGNDHPHYARKAAAETITAQWQWSESLWGPDGSAAEPAFTFLSDQDTGLYRAGANVLGLATAGVIRLQIGATGQLGIDGANYGDANDVLQSRGGSLSPQWVASDPRYLTQVADEYFWATADFVRGYNIIGVRYAGDSTVYLPNDLPSEYIVAIKDEAGLGTLTVRIY